jgi:hypothetical protein
MLLDEDSGRFELEADLHRLQRRTQGLRPHKVRPLLQNYVQVALQHGPHMVLFEVLAEEVVLERVRILVRLLTPVVGPVSIFN